MAADRNFLFEYRFGGDEWGIMICAADPVEAREKIKVVGLARYKGEVHTTIRLPGKSTVDRLMTWWKSRLKS